MELNSSFMMFMKLGIPKLIVVGYHDIDTHSFALTYTTSSDTNHLHLAVIHTQVYFSLFPPRSLFLSLSLFT